jgi:ubiquinone/menaquinone biosynthesis C-methylase UbiE
VAAVDIAPTALARAAAAAGSRNLASRIDFSATTCRIVFLPGRSIWCRISSCILRLASTARGVLRNAARAVAPNGTLLIVDHGSAPPWAWNLAHEHYFPSAEEVVASLSLNADQWQRLRVGSAERQATGPDGQHATVTDNLIALRRIG